MMLKLGKDAARFLLALALVGSVLAGMLAARLSAGPLPLAWATGYMQSALQNAVGADATLTFSDVSLAWNKDTRRIEFAASNVRVVQGGAVLGMAERAGVMFSATKLLQGKLQVKDITLMRPNVQWQLSTAAANAAPNAPSETSALMEFIRHLNSVRVFEGRLTLTVSDEEKVHRVENINLKWQRRFINSSGQLNADIYLAHSASATPILAKLVQDGKFFRINTSLQNLVPGDWKGLLDRFAPGALPPEFSPDRVLMAMNIKANALLDSDGALQTAEAEVTVQDGTVQLPEYYSHPIALRQVLASAQYDANAGIWSLKQLRAAVVDADGPLQLMFSGAGDMRSKTITLNAAIDVLTTDQLKRWWPRGVAPGAIRWLAPNLKSGTIPRVHATVDLAVPGNNVGGDYAVVRASGGFELSNMATTFLKNFPPVTGINGHAVLDENSVHFIINTGQLKDVTVQPGTMDITGLSDADQFLALNIPMTGQLPTLLGLLDTPPYSYIQKMGVNAKTAKGGVGLRLQMKLPMLADLKISEIDYHAVARAADVSLPSVLLGQDIIEGRGDFEMNPKEMRIEGRAKLAQIPLNVVWQDFNAPGEKLRRRVKFSGQLTDTDYAKLPPEFSGRFSGNTLISGDYEAEKIKRALKAHLDFRDAGLVIHELSFSKLRGDDLAADAVMTMQGENGPSEFSITAKGKDLSVSGNGELAASGKPNRLSIQEFRLGKDNNFQLDMVMRGAQERWRITGRSVDLHEWLNPKSNETIAKEKALAEAPVEPVPEKEKAAKNPRWFRVRMDTVVLANDKIVKGVNAELNHNGQHWDFAMVEANLWAGIKKTASAQAAEKPLPLALQWNPNGPGRRLLVRVPDLGAMLSAAGVSNSVIGGKLAIDGEADVSNQREFLSHGKMMLTNFRLRDVPLMARLIAAISTTEIINKLEGKDGVSFDVLESQFEYNDTLLRLREGKMHGASLGLTFEGDIHHAATPQTLLIKGTLVPLSSVSRAISAIPVVGDILGGKDSGIIGFNYKASGKVEDPSVSVNPLSGLTPGFLRDILFDNSAVPSPKQNTNSSDK